MGKKLIGESGIYDVPEDEYLADCCTEPSLSASCAKTLLGKSPLHAFHEHPKLNPNHVRKEAPHFDLGTGTHALILEGHDRFEVIKADDYRKNETKLQRDAARAAGKLPILSHQYDEVLEMASAVTAQLNLHEDEPIPFTAGHPEKTLVWTEETRHGLIYCRARLDWLHHSFAVLDDLKTGAVSAHPQRWVRTLCSMWHDVQAAFYLRGLKKLTGKDALFRFVVCENFAPFATSVISLEPGWLILANRKVEAAIELWAQCLKTDRFPGYPTRTCYVELPPWEEAQWLEREMREIA